MKLIKTWKELVECLPEELRETHKKWLRKIFSVAANNRFDVVVDGDLIEISRTNNNIKVWKVIGLPKTNKLISYKSKHNKFTHITYLKTGFKRELPSMYYRSLVAISKDGTAHNILNISDIRSYLNGPNEVVGFTTREEWLGKLLYNPVYFRRLTWEESGRYTTFLCIKDVDMFKRGMIINYDGYYSLNLKSPLEKLQEIYISIENISCDLNKVTLSQLESFKVDVATCVKQKFGCSRGCLTSCSAENTNHLRKKLKQTYINLYKEIYE